jgi:hypothetical protein
VKRVVRVTIEFSADRVTEVMAVIREHLAPRGVSLRRLTTIEVSDEYKVEGQG